MMPVPMIVNPIPLKPKGGFLVEDLVGRSTERLSPKYQNTNSPINVLKPDAYFNGYPVVPRSELQNSFEQYTPSMYTSLATQDLVNLEYLELLRSRMPMSSSPAILGTDMHPWLFNRHPRFFPHRIQGPEPFLFHPFRKPKRVRTAFSPAQLLQLEHAFEKNHYVVGNERRQLADALNLTETQVKVWFQNRRTKHKRQKQDDDQSPESKGKDFCDTQEHSLSSEDESAALQEINSPNNDKNGSLWNSSNAKALTTSSVSAFPLNYCS